MNYGRTIASITLANALAFGGAVAAAPKAQAATAVGSTFAKCNPLNVKHDPDYNVRGEQTYTRTKNPTGKVLTYKATPTFTIVRNNLPDFKYVFVRVELIRPGVPMITRTANSGSFGSLASPMGRYATTTKFGWYRYVGGQFDQALWCSISTPAIP